MDAAAGSDQVPVTSTRAGASSDTAPAGLTSFLPYSSHHEAPEDSVPIKTVVDDKQRLVHFELSGDLVTDEMLAAVDEAYEQVPEGEVYDVLSNNRALNAPATPAQIKALVGRLAEHGKRVEGSRCAVIVGHVASYGMMRLMGAHTESLGIEVGAFWKMEDALAFLDRSSGSDSKA